jgi:ferritin
MLNAKIEKALNDQINKEMFSCNLYLAMSAWFDAANLEGFAHWMRVQAREEWGHAMKLFGYVVQRGGRATVGAVAAPAQEWASPLATYKAAYEHECGISASLNALFELATAEKDWATTEMLGWFITEQVEEEASADYFVQKLEMAKDAPGGIMILDRAAAAREG